ncbi:hypothetical protein [Sanguibacter sp. Z1732]|uniref:hypothetical protein n=1 Tax=Sanguibacter sp. Z1732 TaxID=3435412 RepID=UPI003D9C89AF
MARVKANVRPLAGSEAHEKGAHPGHHQCAGEEDCGDGDDDRHQVGGPERGIGVGRGDGEDDRSQQGHRGVSQDVPDLLTITAPAQRRLGQHRSQQRSEHHEQRRPQVGEVQCGADPGTGHQPQVGR